MVEGEPTAICTNRTFLKRAIDLGFREMCLFGGDDARVLCHNGQCTYVWMLLDKSGVITRNSNATSVASPQEPTTRAVAKRPRVQTQIETPKEEAQMSRTKRSISNGQPMEETRWRTVETDQPVLVQAEALRDSLREVLLKANDLISALKRQRRQTKLVQSTLASLKELQAVAG
jgi:hypothetical protein